MCSFLELPTLPFLLTSSRLTHHFLSFTLLWVHLSTAQSCILLFFHGTPGTYGSSWASVWIGAAAEACTTATVVLDSSRICDLCHSLQQCWIPNPLSKARDGTTPSERQQWVLNLWVTMGTPCIAFNRLFKPMYMFWYERDVFVSVLSYYFV